MKKKAIHIVVDEKFIDSAINNFTLAGVFEHYFYCLSKGNEVKHIKQIEKIQIVKYDDIIDIINSGGYQVVFLHSMLLRSKDILKIKDTIKIVWLSWGGDIYGSRQIFNFQGMINLPLCKPQTLSYIYTSIYFIINTLLNIAQQIKSRKTYLAEQKIYAISTVLPIEYKMIKERNRRFGAKYFYHSYINNILKIEQHIEGENILIGNSASITNNHLDILKILKRHIKFDDREIIMPLSYGDGAYKKFLTKKVTKLNYLNIKPLIDFMPLDEYYKVLNSCQYAIFGHIRQQAIGNIYRCIYQGSKVFLYKDAVAYKYLKEQGYIVCAIEDINKYELNTPLTEKEKQHNKELYLKHMDYDTYINDLKNELRKLL